MKDKVPAVILVEDDLPTIELYHRTLGEAHHIIACDETDDIIHYLETMPILAVVLEPAIKNGSGWKVLEAIQKKTAELQVPVVLCSILDDRNRGLKMGAATFLIKPVLPATLLRILNGFIR
jgi:DNA-binding response OmpR family regulator